jgi:hypothetical protein
MGGSHDLAGAALSSLVLASLDPERKTGLYVHPGQQSGRIGAPDERGGGSTLDLWTEKAVDRLT